MSVYMEQNLDMPLSEVLQVIQDRLMTKSTYFGIQTLKNPFDFWIYQEIIIETKPDVIIEIGNYCGGSTLALAHICDLLDRGSVIGLDIAHGKVPDHVRKHPRITFIEGDACRSFKKVRKLIKKDDVVLIIEDSNHTYDNTLRVLDTYSTLIKPGGYFIVEDGIIHHGLDVGPNPGPYEAIETFANENSDYEIDRSRESFLITWNPKGYLKRRNYTDKNSSINKINKLHNRTKKNKVSKREIIKLFIPPIFLPMIRKLFNMAKFMYKRSLHTD
jgi:cephalosporin hydroxylase